MRRLAQKLHGAPQHLFASAEALPWQSLRRLGHEINLEDADELGESEITFSVN
jgi:hypothetical protein